MILTKFTAKITNDFSKKKDELHKYSYIFCCLLYSIANCLSKLSLKWVKFRKVWIFSILQFFLCVIFWKISSEKKIGIYPLFFLNFVVGIIGGLCFTNSNFMVIESGEIEKSLKEVSINISICAIDVAILLCSVTGIFLK